MFFTVVDERVQLDKSLVAHLAVVGPQAFVETYAQSDVWRPHKGAAADAALEVPQAAFHLGPQDCLCQQRPAHLARRLGGFVREQDLQRGKALTALLTLARPVACVQANMRQETSLLPEGLVAVGALEGLLSRVQTVVSLEMRKPA